MGYKLFIRFFYSLFIITSLNCFPQATKNTFWQLLKKTAVAPPTLKAFTLSTIPFGNLDLLTPNRGANTFFTQTQWANIPDPAVSTWSLDNNQRFYWSLIETSQGVYNWTDLDNIFATTISRRQRIDIRVMTLDTDASSAYNFPVAGGARLQYPVYVHNQMQAESVTDWTYTQSNGTTWIPNWNSPSYLTAWDNFCKALNQHLNTASSGGVLFKNVVSKIDIAGFGNYSEWHSYPFINSYPSNAQKATSATLTQIVNIHLNDLPSWPALGNIAMWTGEVPLDVGYYVFFASNAWGRIGIINDHFGWTSTYMNDVPNNTRTFNGVVFGQQIQIQYQVAPIVGEPMNDATAVTTGGTCAFWHMETEIRAYHASQFNNQNGTGVTGTCVNNNYLASSKACGYRIQMESGSVSNNMPSGSPMQLNLRWSNVGIAPNYENWNVRVDLRNAGGTVVWFGNSSMAIKFFQPQTNFLVTDNFALPSLPAGTYSVNVMVQDAAGYRNPLPLYNTGVRADGSYQLTTVTII